MKTILGEFQSILFCPRHIKTGEYVDSRYDRTEDVSEAIGWGTAELCKKDITTFDEPDEWEVVEKLTTILTVK